jgi:hypothetical protein
MKRKRRSHTGGKASPWVILMDKTDLEYPPKPTKLRVTFAREADRIHLRYRRGGRVFGVFVLLWLAGWTAGCIWLLFLVLGHAHSLIVLFAIPFWSSWVFVFFLLLKTLFQTDDMLLDSNGLLFTRRVLVQTIHRFMPLHELQSFDEYSATVGDGGPLEYGIELRNLGNPLRLLQGPTKQEITWLRRQFNDLLAELRSRNALPLTQPGIQDIVTAPPSDSSWKRIDAFVDLAFTRKGRFSPVVVFAALFINLFWDGLLSVFIAMLLKPPASLSPAAWWFFFYFLLPFEACGLVAFGVLIAVIFAPLHQIRWRFTLDTIERTHTWFGLPLRKRWQVAAPLHLEFTRGIRHSSVNMAPQSEISGDWSLRFMTPGNRRLCSIRRLTEGEARWIQHTLLHERPSWFCDC